MSFNDGSGSLTTQLNNAAQSIINVAECDDFPDEPTQTRISRKEDREYKNRIKETLPIALADGSETRDIIIVIVFKSQKALWISWFGAYFFQFP